MSPEEQKAESWKYSNSVVLILPLDNGRFAVYNNARELSEIVEGEALLSALTRVRPVTPLAKPERTTTPTAKIPLSELLKGHLK